MRTAPPAAAAALLYAVVKLPWAVCATGSPKCVVPVSVPGGNPVTESAGHIPISPVTLVAPMLLTTGVAPRIPKVQAAPSARAGGGAGHVAELVNIHTLFAASELPNVSFAPVVIVAVKIVLGARGPEGVKVAILVEEL